MSDLKPCPFCGGEASIYGNEQVKFIWCTSCGTNSAPYRNQEKAYAAWNRRADAPRKTAECPPTEADGERIDSDWLPGKNSVIAWSAIHKLWVTKKVVSVASYPDDYPFWIPAPPNPEITPEPTRYICVQKCPELDLDHEPHCTTISPATVYEDCDGCPVGNIPKWEEDTNHD